MMGERADKNRIRRGLLRWYDAHRREMPWRPRKKNMSADPYQVLVSEAMLQQTQVATVIDYFHRFVAALPTVEALAATDEQQVLRLWQGLGYYRRARHLHAAAQMIVQVYDGRVPDTVEGLLKLPGVGPYTAGAIASIAYHRRAAIVDGNVARVLARVFCLDEPVDTPKVRRALWALAGEVVSPSRPGDFNQAMMDLGATVCVPRSPKCEVCPLRKICGAAIEGKVDELPVVSKRTKPKAVTHTVIAVQRRGQFLFEQRPAKGLWSNMWQFPTVDQKVDAIAWVRDRFGLSIEAAKSLECFTHQTTHRTIEFRVVVCEVKTGRLRRGCGQWRKLDNLDDLPMANPQRRTVKLLGKI